MLVVPGPRKLANDNSLYDPDSFDVYSCSYTADHHHPSSLKSPTARRIDPAKIPRRAIDLFAGLKLKGRSTTKRRRRSTAAMTIAGKDSKSGNFSSSALAKKKSIRETKISRPVHVFANGWEVGDLINSDHPGLQSSPSSSPPTPPPGEYSRPTTPLLPEPPSPRSMITGPPSQQSLPSIPPSPTSPVSDHLSLVSNLSGPLSNTQFFAGTPPPARPLPQLPSEATLNPRIPPMSSSSPRTPPLPSLRGEQWPLRDDSRLDNMCKAQSVWPCPEPSRKPPTTPGTSSPSSIRPESRKELPKTGLSLWPAQESSRKPRNTSTVSLSPNEPRPKPRGGKGRMEPSPWLSSPTPSSPSPKQGSLGGEPGMDLSPCSTGPSPSHQSSYDWGGSLSSSPISAEVETEPLTSPRRPSHRRGPCGANPPTISPSPPSPSPRLGGETKMEPFQRLKSQPHREGSLVRGPRMVPSPWLASPTSSPRPLGQELSMEPSQRLTSHSPSHGPLGREPRMEPSPWQVSSPHHRPKPLGGEPPMETSPRLTSQQARQGPLGREPRIEPYARPTNTCPPRPSPGQRPFGWELSTEPGLCSATRPTNHRGPHEGYLTTWTTLNHEPRKEPPTRLTGPTSPGRGGPFGGELRASSSTYTSSRPSPGMEPAPLLPRSTIRSESRVRESPISNSTSLEPANHTVSSQQPPPPPPPVTYPSPYYVHPAAPPETSGHVAAAAAAATTPPPGPSHTPSSSSTNGGLAPPPPPSLPDIIEARDETVLLDFPITYHLALACAEDKHSSEMAESEQQLEYFKLKTRLYEDFFLSLEAGRSSSVPGRGRREPRGRPRSLGEVKFRLESQLRVMKAEQTWISKGSGGF